VKLSILVPTLPSRFEKATGLLRKLSDQAGTDAQVLWLGDNKTLSVGRKRNILLSLASGDYVSFVDDDDDVSDDYVQSIIVAAESNPDCIVFDVQYSRRGKPWALWKFSIDYEIQHKERPWTSTPTHIMAWRRDLVKDIQFPDANYAEDTDWSAVACGRIKTQERIERVLYHYRYDIRYTETQKGK
jgi:glycosyltransferase involved in cell wall biosynthesis